MSAKRISYIVISHDDDAHLPYVQKYLDQELTLVNPFKIIDNVELSYRFEGSKAIITYDGTELKDVKAVWYRKPDLIDDIKLPVEDKYLQYSRDTITRHIAALRASFPEAYWVSDYYAIQRAENKFWQLQMAHRVGFNVPETVITSDRAIAERFIKKHDNTIVKSLTQTSPEVTRETVLFSTKINHQHSFDLGGLNLAPAIFQQAINAVTDVRVTVVGDEVFAAAVQDKGIEEWTEIRDWRISQLMGKVKFEPYKLSKSTVEWCIKLVRKLGLVYGAIDLVVDENGKEWFLEINPNGQWAFIEDETGQPIGKAIAELLKTGRV